MEGDLENVPGYQHLVSTVEKSTQRDEKRLMSERTCQSPTKLDAKPQLRTHKWESKTSIH